MTPTIKVAIALVVGLFLVIVIGALLVNDVSTLNSVREFGASMGRVIP